MFKSLPFSPREVKATEATLERIYKAAQLGLKGDSLALAAGLLPIEFRQLCELDPIADMAARKGKADGEYIHAEKLHEASMNGDTKASLAILQHVHGWVAKQQVEVTKIDANLRDMLEERDARIRGMVYEHDGSAAGSLATDDERGDVLLPSEVRDVELLVGRE